MTTTAEPRSVVVTDGKGVHNVPPLATCSYRAFDPIMGVPVRTSVGANRYFSHRGILEFARTITPYGVFKNPNLPTLEDRHVAYLDRLDRHLGEVLAELDEIAMRHPGETLVLLCYENVHDGSVCHRRWFADWFLSHFDVEIPEVSPSAAASGRVRSPRRRADTTPPSLF